MQTFPWWAYSILAAIIWGLHFNLVVKVSTVLPRDIFTPLTLFFITSLSILFVLPFSYQRIWQNIQSIMQSEDTIRHSALLMIFTAITGASLLYTAMRFSGNATVASLLDITYPVFVALIAWLVFKENHIDWSVIVGGLLIFSGSILIIWQHS